MRGSEHVRVTESNICDKCMKRIGEYACKEEREKQSERVREIVRLRERKNVSH